MSFVRSGPKMLIIESKDIEAFKNFVNNHFKTLTISEKIKNFEDIISEMNHHQTLIYLTAHAKENILNFNVLNCLVVNESAQIFLMKVINLGACQMISYIRKAPRMVIMKVIGNIDNTLSNIADDFKAVVEPTKSVFFDHAEGTVICFTKANISKKLVFADFYSKSVYTDEHFSEVINVLDHHALKYINRNVENKAWYDLTIKIYDSFGAYKIQYDRLIFILDKIGAGLILKEGWGEDAAKIFLIVGVYTVNLYTYMEPNEIKKILLALEYIENGERIVDFDLFYKKKKIHWDNVKIKGVTTRASSSSHYRHELYKNLEDEDVNTLRSMEDYIFASR